MRLGDLNTVRNRLILLFFAITAAAVGFVYLYVVPQLESSLTAREALQARGPAARRRSRRGWSGRIGAGLSQPELAALLRQALAGRPTRA